MFLISVLQAVGCNGLGSHVKTFVIFLLKKKGKKETELNRKYQNVLW